jgi:CheY-like chemotaxis protein
VNERQERTECIPMILLTTRENRCEAERCDDLGCNAYVTKPREQERFCKAIRRMGLFLSVVTVPNGG